MTLARRIVLAFAALLLAFSVVVALLGRVLAAEREAVAQQRLSHGLARHIVEHWPQVARPPAVGDGGRAERDALLGMLMTVNPAIEVYLLDADGRVEAYLGDPGQVRGRQVDLAPVRAFLGGAPLPVRGTDPKVPGRQRLFSAAMFAPRAGERRPPGYLYVVLEGQARDQVAAAVDVPRELGTAAGVLLAALLVTLALGAFVSRRLSAPLEQLARRMQAFGQPDGSAGTSGHPGARAGGDEVVAIAGAFDAMAARIERQASEQAAQQASHREVVAGMAHDLRTPLTVLHAHLEAVDLGKPAEAGPAGRHLAAALAQSHKVRVLSQQLFELATLQSTDQVLQRERFRLDELVTDAVQKFDLAAPGPAVALAGPAPGRVDLEGDLHLVERALTNLIANALRHAPCGQPVRVSLRRDGRLARVTVEDHGPGLPAELAQRLDAGRPVRDPPLRHAGGGIGGLGLAIAQRVAWLHGGSLTTLPGEGSGTRLCLALPLAMPAG